MKTLILIAALAFPASAEAQTPQTRENCAALAGFAHALMFSHQNGTPLTAMTNIIDEHFPDPAMNDAMMALALQAYGGPRYVTEGAQERAAADFRDRVHVECLQ